MSREIKFRSWDKILKIMCYNPVNAINFNGQFLLNDGKFHDINKTDYILMQYTGLKDKNGKEIYEGDIVGGTLEDGTNGRSPVFWCYNCYQPFSYLNCRSEDLEILGNIYKNPELIGDKND